MVRILPLIILSIVIYLVIRIMGNIVEAKRKKEKLIFQSKMMDFDKRSGRFRIIDDKEKIYFPKIKDKKPYC